MTAAEAIADVERTVELWRASGITAGQAWLALTGQSRSTVKWDGVKVVMIRLALGRDGKRCTPPPMRFVDYLPAVRDHGSAGKLLHPGTRLAA